MTYTIKDLVTEYKPLVEKGLNDCLANPGLAQFRETLLDKSVKYSALDGGKRLRAILALITAEAILKSESPIENNPASKLASALELVHAGSLIHDDLPCMDDDDLRRGKASNHKAFNEATALLAGDFLLCYPIQLVDSEIKNEFTQAIIDMIIGQQMDLSLGEAKNPQVESIKEMEALKTGALIKASVVLAAKLANASEDQIQALTKYSQNIGLAFQIADDILDVTASTEELGKTSGKDEKQNKFTYVKEYGIEKAKEIAKDLINEAKTEIKSNGLFPDKLLLIADYVISRNN